MSIDILDIPATGFAGMKENWHSDLIAALSVAMVALPLALGIAQASGVPPMAGVMSAAIGGLVTSFFRGSHLAINGPAAGLITVVLGATYALNDGSGKSFQYVLAAIVIAGALQVLMGMLRLGRLGEIFPSSVIHGVLAAIGVIIFTTQLDDTFGFSYSVGAKSIIQKLLELPSRLSGINPLVALIGAGSLSLLLLYPRIKSHLVRFIPAPMWVLALGIGATLGFGLQDTFSYHVLGKSFSVGSSFLVNIPDNISEIILFPDFSRIGDAKFWMAVLSIFMIASIESLASSKAVDKLDPFKRTTNLDKDLVGIGLSTVVSGFLGGLPIITVIVRSSVNVNNHARTKWSNLYHGIILVAFIFLLAPLIKLVPLAALGAILVHTGYKLAGPRIFKQTSLHGWEQVTFLIGTLLITLATDLLWGIFAGMFFTLLFHLNSSRMSLFSFIRNTLKPAIEVETVDSTHRVSIVGVSNFLNVLKLQSALKKLPQKESVVVDLSQAQLVDLTIMEYLQGFKLAYERVGGQFHSEGVEGHTATTTHPLALRTRSLSLHPPLNARQGLLKEWAGKRGCECLLSVEWENLALQDFHFFETRPIEYRENRMGGSFELKKDYQWEIADVTFDEGALLATEVFHSTILFVELPFEIPRFTLEKESRLDTIFDRVMKTAGFVDIDFQLFPQFSGKYLLMGKDEEEIRCIFSPSLIELLEEEDHYHIESSGKALLFFRRLRLARVEGIAKMHDFAEKFVARLESNESKRKEIEGK